MKKLIIKLIKIYQEKAPSKIRGGCLFTPTCSEYMILAIEKYGTIRGIIKGVHRIFRCKCPNGGIDYP